MTQQKQILSSPIGALEITVRNTKISALRFVKKAPTSRSPLLPVVQKLKKWLDSYFKGQTTKAFPLELIDLSQGTSFQQKVWKTLRKIPHGKTVSYSWLANQIGNPKASRAVGGANGANPVPLIVPCHRVIAADGSLGGFSCGLPLKKKLLKNEGLVF